MLIILETGLAESRGRELASEITLTPAALWFALLDPSQSPAGISAILAAVNSYTRTTIREESFMRRILPPIPVPETETVLC